MTHRRPRVRIGRFHNEETDETTPVFLHSHEEIDAEIDRRIRADVCAGRARLITRETSRAKFHALLSADACPR